jgi:uncharacterized lipoprotein YmbA
MTLKPFITALLIVLLSACARQAVDKQHYFLPSPGGQPATTDKLEAARLLQISDVSLADFLDKSGLVLQLDDITLNQAKNHVWAEDLGQQINRGLQARLNRQQQPYTVVGSQTDAALRLSIEIHAFHGRYDGLALTSGQWQLRNQQGKVEQIERFDLQTELKQSGYPALVRALGENLDKLSGQIAGQLQQRHSASR